MDDFMRQAANTPIPAIAEIYYEAHEDVEEDDEPDPYSAPEAMELILIEH